MTRIVAVVALLLVCSGANAQTGSEFREGAQAWRKIDQYGLGNATESERILSSEYTMYISGFVNGIIIGQRDSTTKLVCLPEDVKGDQLFLEVYYWLSEYPTRYDQPAYALALLALNDVWPCPE